MSDPIWDAAVRECPIDLSSCEPVTELVDNYLRVSVDSLQEVGPVSNLLRGMNCVLHYRKDDGTYEQVTPRVLASQMSRYELLEKIGALQAALFRLVCGDQAGCVTVAPGEKVWIEHGPSTPQVLTSRMTRDELLDTLYHVQMELNKRPYEDDARA